MTRQSIGRRGEDLACKTLLSRGYHILHRNWRRRHGEIDIVAQDGDQLVIVEVKTSQVGAGWIPEEGLDPRKLARLAAMGEAYIAENKLGQPDWRVDLVAIELARDGDPTRINIVTGVGIDV